MTRLGKYELINEIGRGGYGTVYLAEETVLGVNRAVKLLSPVLVAAPEFVERFKREARLSARLEHAHIVPVYELDEAQGSYYLAMKYMSGGSLKDLLEREGRLSYERALEILYQIAEGLSFAHQAGVIHRDIKPGNLLFEEDGTARLGDFGFARALADSGSSLSLSTSGNGMVGTASYMAPELWDDKPASPASDQYALTCVFVEMLTGEVLFGGKTPIAIMKKHEKGGELPANWPQGVPDGITEVIEKGLTKASGERFKSISEFMEALKLTGKKANEEARQKAAEEDRQRKAEEKARQDAREAEKQKLAAAQQSAEKKAEELRQENEKLKAELSGRRENEKTRQEAARKENEEKAREAAGKKKNENEKVIQLTGGLKMAFIKIPAGEFLYGDKKERKVIPQDYWIGKYPVTNEQYQQFVNANPNYQLPNLWDYWSRSYPQGKGKHPVVWVSWEDAQAFCKWAGCRLPTEEEWEKAARGTDGRKYPWGEDWEDGKYCNDWYAKIIDTTQVDSYPMGVSPYGVWDMSGNVWEWTGSKYDQARYVLRGGSWAQFTNCVCSAYRDRTYPNHDNDYDHGFRCVLPVP